MKNMEWYIVLFILALLLVLRPDLMWKLERRFDSEEEQPKGAYEAYTKIARIGGIAIILYVLYKTFL